MLGFRYFGSSNEEVGGELVEQKQILQNFRRFRHFERDSPEKREKKQIYSHFRFWNLSNDLRRTVLEANMDAAVTLAPITSTQVTLFSK